MMTFNEKLRETVERLRGEVTFVYQQDVFFCGGEWWMAIQDMDCVDNSILCRATLDPSRETIVYLKDINAESKS